MRRSLALVIVLLAASGFIAPVANAAPANPKVVIIVGATQGATSSYRAKADQAYAEAIKYTTDVVKVYSPNATWSKVKAATKGASIVVYFGHGNGWPSPYTYDPQYTTKNGFGLNASAGNGDNNTKYYGEPYVSQLALAPNAVVILSNLCYASGNSEPGDPPPSQATARKRVDNFAAGFLKAARAVIADGLGSPGPYIRGLFTTNATIQEVWRAAPNYNGNELSFPSSRTPGATAYTDTDSPTAGYYRSLVTRPGLTSEDVTGASYADTGTDPLTLTIPGNATVGDADAVLYDADGAPSGSIPAGTRLRVVAPGPGIASIGEAAVEVEGIDDPALSGWVAAGDLVARDSAAPAIWGLETGLGVVSPNGDGRSDAVTVSGRFSEPVAWRVRVSDGDTIVHESTGDGDEMAVAWDALDGGAALPDGTYDIEVRVDDAWGNGPTTRETTVRVDTAAAQLTALSPAEAADRWFSPDSDGSRDTVTWSGSMGEAGSLVMQVDDAGGDRVRSETTGAGSGATALTWDGRDEDGDVVPDGIYEVRITPRDRAGTSGDAMVRTVRVDTTLGRVTTSKALFYPQDGDSLAPSTTLGYTLRRDATVTWQIRDAGGAVVATLVDGAPTAAGVQTRGFAGIGSGGGRLPTGTYTSVVVATHADGTVTQATTFRMMAFSLSLSDSTPKRGQSITVRGTSAEPLDGRPRLVVKQPGVGKWSVTMSRTTSGYAATVALRKGGPAGPVSFKVVGDDKLGNSQQTTLRATSH